MASHTANGKVLVVNDEVFVQMRVADVLDEAGFEVIEAADAQIALKRLELAQDLQVLFTDINMPPGMDGLELARRVYAQWPQIGLVVTSGYERRLDDEIADGGLFVPKPFRPETIISVVQQAASRSCS